MFQVFFPRRWLRLLFGREVSLKKKKTNKLIKKIRKTVYKFTYCPFFHCITLWCMRAFRKCFPPRRWLRLLFGREVSLSSLLVVWDALFWCAGEDDLPMVDFLSLAILDSQVFTSEAAGSRTQKPRTAAVKAVRQCAQNQKHKSKM